MPGENENNLMDSPTLNQSGEGEQQAQGQAGENQQTPAGDNQAIIAENEVQNLLAELERAGVTDTQGIRNKLTAASESGRLANLLGEERERTKGLEREIARLQGSVQRQPNQQIDNQAFSDFFGGQQDPYYQGQSVDLKSTINEVLDERDQRTRTQATQQQQAMMQLWNTITNDEDYGLVKDVWEEKLKDPNFVFQIQSGQVNPLGEYQQLLRNYYKNMVKGSANLIKKLAGEQTLGPQHIEQGDNTPANLVQGNQKEDPRTARVKALKEKAAKGLLDEEEELELATIAFL